MNILKAIGAAFSRFWRWIRETAWVQPLLIVGGIFAIIFSIPKFTTWFSAMGAESSSAYFTSFRYSLEGEGGEDLVDGTKVYTQTAADKLTLSIYDYSSATKGATTAADGKADFSTYESFHKALEDSGYLAKYGEKFFLAYVSSEDGSVDNAQGGFETLEDNWKTNFTPSDGRSFALKTIFTDEVSTNDDDYELDSDKIAFSRYLNKWNGGEGGKDFFSYVGPELIEAPYKTNKSVSDTNYEHITTPTEETFDCPTIFLIDYSKEAYECGRYGVSEVLFSVSGDDDYARATLLLQMWNHVDYLDSDGEVVAKPDTTNPFSPYYVK